MRMDEIRGFDVLIRTMRIIVGTLAVGVIFFGVLVLTVLSDARPPQAADEPMIMGLPLMTALAVAFGAISIVASYIVPKVVTANGLRAIAGGATLDETKPTESGQRQVYPANDVDRLLPLYQTQLIIASALNEGGAFFALLAYMLEGRAASLAVAGVLVAVMLTRFPVADRVRGWLDIQLERLAAVRRDELSTGP